MPLVPQCAFCGACAPTALRAKCTKCKAVQYCSTAHCAADLRRHGKACRQVVAARKYFAAEDKKLRRMEVDFMAPGEVFEACVGYFWLQFETRPYMRAKFMLIDALVAVGSALATEEALKEASECLTLDEQDHQGVREIVPALMLLLGKVQEAYDFIYYWAGNHDNDVSENEAGGEEDEDEEGEEGRDDETMDEARPPRIVPCLRPTRMNPTDPVDFFIKPYVASIFHRSALTFIKLTTAFGLNGAVKQLLDPAATSTTKAPLLDFLQANKLPTEVTELQALYEKLLEQAKQAYDLAQKQNAHLWPALLDPVTMLRSPPSFYSLGSPDEVRQHLEVYAKLWHTTPYAIGYVAQQLQA